MGWSSFGIRRYFCQTTWTEASIKPDYGRRELYTSVCCRRWLWRSKTSDERWHWCGKKLSEY